MKTGMLIAPLPGTQEPSVFLLDRPRTVIGRDADCDLVIDDGRVSRRHVVLQQRGGVYVVDDQDSRNGTRVNGVAVIHQRLRHGDRLSVGGVGFTFEEGEPPDAAAGFVAPAGRGDAGETVAQRGLTDGVASGSAALQAWQIVRNCPLGSGADARPWLEELAAGLSGAAGVGHVLIFLPAGALGPGEIFIRRGTHEGRGYQEQTLREVAQRMQIVGLAAGRRVPVRHAGQALDAVYVPLSLPSEGAGCLYVDGAEGLPAELSAVILSVAEALSVGFRLMASAPASRAGIMPGRGPEPESGIVGRSRALQDVIRVARKAAASKYAVLVRGETGTGKELISRLIFQESERRDAPYLPVHCSGIEDTLLGSALFGHEKGAFTGAVATRKGFFEETDGGTIFLDEIGELSSATQVKLLRVLQEGEFMRLGSNVTRKVDVRVVAATNRNLEADIETGTFREDLYYRLKVFEIQVPPLRERKEDIPDLVNHFVETVRRAAPTTVESVGADALAALQNYGWPGNIRELQNVMERAMVLAEGKVLRREDLPLDVLGAPALSAAAPGGAAGAWEPLPLKDVEDRHILAMYAHCAHNQAETARRLGISRSTLIERLKPLQRAD